MRPIFIIEGHNDSHTMTRKSQDRRMHEGAKSRDGRARDVGAPYRRDGRTASAEAAGEVPHGNPSATDGSLRAAWPDVTAALAPDSSRIAKAMARAGLCSRRDAEAWIAAGRVAVNGGTIRSPAVTVTARDRITVDGKPLPRRERTRLFLFHKPEGLVSTSADPQGRPTVFDGLPANLPRLMSVGRLDIGTEGLLLLTNDGGLARVLELPRTAWLRCYRVRAHGRVDEGALAALRDGITIDGIQYGPVEAKLEHQQGSNAWLSFAIREGKNREVRNVLAHIGLMVNRLIRVSFGPFRLDDLAPGEIAEVPTHELRKQLGEQITAQAGCDFSVPAIDRAAAASRIGRTQRDQKDREQRGHSGSRPDSESRDHNVGSRERSAGHRNERTAPRDRGGGDKANASERAAKPRPRRGHAWRQDDAPLRRHYRGERRAELRISDDEASERRTGLLSDRKGRRVMVERLGVAKASEPAANSAASARHGAEPRVPHGDTKPPRQARPPRRPPRDRSSGPRPSRPKLSAKAQSREFEDRPEKFPRSARRPAPSKPPRPRVSSRPPQPRRPSRGR